MWWLEESSDSGYYVLSSTNGLQETDYCKAVLEPHEGSLFLEDVTQSQDTSLRGKDVTQKHGQDLSLIL